MSDIVERGIICGHLDDGTINYYAYITTSLSLYYRWYGSNKNTATEVATTVQLHSVNHSYNWSKYPREQINKYRNIRNVDIEILSNEKLFEIEDI